MRETVNNVEFLIKKYGYRIDEDKKLILAYWKDFDGVYMDKEFISVIDFLSKATDPREILDARELLRSIDY